MFRNTIQFHRLCIHKQKYYNIQYNKRIEQNIFIANDDVSYLQEYYTYTSSNDLDTVQLAGDYISEDDAAFFQARTTNEAPVFGEIYLDINGEATDTRVPGAQTFTRVFISDVVNDSDTTSFESALVVACCCCWCVLLLLLLFCVGELGGASFRAKNSYKSTSCIVSSK